MTSRLAPFLSPLRTLGRGRLAAIAVGSGAAAYVGVVTYRWQRRLREKKATDRLTLFFSGVALGVIAMATGPAFRRWRGPRPDRVFSSVLPMLRANTEVREMVGPSLRPGLFRAHTHCGGVKWSGVRWSNWRPFSLQPYSLQLLFQVHGEISSALVSLEAVNHTPWGRGLLYKSLVVDLPNGERLVLKGHITDSIVEGYSTRL